jgi:hypothetical protein
MLPLWAPGCSASRTAPPSPIAWRASLIGPALLPFEVDQDEAIVAAETIGSYHL